MKEEEQLYICDHANICGDINCYHSKPHILEEEDWEIDDENGYRIDIQYCTDIAKCSKCYLNRHKKIEVRCIKIFKKIEFIKENEFMV